MKQIPTKLLGYKKQQTREGMMVLVRKGDKYLYKGYDPRVMDGQFLELLNELVDKGWEVTMKSTPRKNITHFSHYTTLTSPEGMVFSSFGTTARRSFCNAAERAAAWDG